MEEETKHEHGDNAGMRNYVLFSRKGVRTVKFSQIRAWLDDRGKEYEKDGNSLKAYRGIKFKSHIEVAYLNSEYLVGLNRYSSQKEVINKEINAFYHNEYKEVK